MFDYHTQNHIHYHIQMNTTKILPLCNCFHDERGLGNIKMIWIKQFYVHLHAIKDICSIACARWCNSKCKGMGGRWRWLGWFFQFRCDKNALQDERDVDSNPVNDQASGTDKCTKWAVDMKLLTTLHESNFEPITYINGKGSFKELTGYQAPRNNVNFQKTLWQRFPTHHWACKTMPAWYERCLLLNT